MEMLMTILKKDTEKIDEIFWEKAIDEADNQINAFWITFQMGTRKNSK